MNNLKNPSSNLQDWSIFSRTISRWTTLVLKLNGIKDNKIKFVFNQKEKYSVIISIYLVQN